MAKLRTYIAMFRVAFGARDDLHAQSVADHLDARMSEHLDDKDTIRLTQLFTLGDPTRAEEFINHLKLARNDLCRLPYRDTMDIALLVDKVIYRLEKMVPEDESIPNDYDHNRILQVHAAISRGENPLF